MPFSPRFLRNANARPTCPDFRNRNFFPTGLTMVHLLLPNLPFHQGGVQPSDVLRVSARMPSFSNVKSKVTRRTGTPMFSFIANITCYQNSRHLSTSKFPILLKDQVPDSIPATPSPFR